MEVARRQSLRVGVRSRSLVDGLEALVAVADDDHGTPRGGRPDVAHDARRGRVVEVGDRLVEEDDRSSRQHRAGQREPGPLSARDAASAGAERGCPGRRAGRRTSCPSPETRRASTRSPSVASGRARTRLARRSAAKTWGSSSTTATRSRTASSVQLRGVVPVDEVAAGGGVEGAREDGEQRRLARPVGADDPDPAPRREVEVDRSDVDPALDPAAPYALEAQVGRGRGAVARAGIGHGGGPGRAGRRTRTRLCSARAWARTASASGSTASARAAGTTTSSAVTAGRQVRPPSRRGPSRTSRLPSARGRRR